MIAKELSTQTCPHSVFGGSKLHAVLRKTRLAVPSAVQPLTMERFDTCRVRG